jgi:putative MATE family efflux protein
MINNLIKTIHDIIDMYFVADIPNYGIESVNSISLTFPVVFTFISLGIGLSAAGTALISQFVGSNQLEDARKYASNLVMISLITGIVLNIVSFFSAHFIMSAMGLTGYELAESVKYLRIRSFELPVVFVFFAFTSIRQSTGDTVTPVIYGVVTMVLNIVLSPILISTLSMGVSGAAYATLIANVVIMPVGLLQLFKSKTGITITKKYLILDKDISYKIIRVAIPASFGQAFTAIGFGLMNGVLVGYGKQTVAAFSVGNRISSLILHPVMAIGGVLSAYLGQNIGNQNVERARQTFKKGMILSVGLMAVGSLIFIPFRGYASAIFIKGDDVALELAKDYMLFLLIGLPLMGAFQNFLGTYNGTGNTKYTFILTVTRLWILRIPLVLIFKNFTTLGSSGVWYAMLISNVVILFIGMIMYRKIDYKPKIRIKKVNVLAPE